MASPAVCTRIACSCSPANRNIDYDGNGGSVQIGMEGDPQVARFQVFTFDPTGVDHTGRIVTITP